jgi:hypothetical protein
MRTMAAAKVGRFACCETCVALQRHRNKFVLIYKGFFLENSRPKIRHGFDMAGEKFDMPSGPGTLVARTLLLVKTGSADRKRDEQLLSETPSGSKALDVQNSTWLWQNTTCPRHQINNKIKQK